MNETSFEMIMSCAKALKIDSYAAGLPEFFYNQGITNNDIEILSKVFQHLKECKEDAVVSTLLRLSRLPLKNPKTFENFDFTRIHGKGLERLMSLSTLSPLYAHKNLAFIGPPGVGKTHLAMAFGRECCYKGIRAYFLKASELNQRFSDARRLDHVGRMITFLVKPSCLIIDEVGRSTFDLENTRLFFDLIDRRQLKEGSSCMIFTSNKSPDTWGEYFSEDTSTLCALDRIFDDASVFLIKGESYRGRKLETFKLEAGNMLPVK